MSTRTIAGAWDLYRASVLPVDASPVQLRECRRAFYAGFIDMLLISTEVGEPSVSIAEGVETFQALSREAQAFIALVAEGRL